MSKEELLKKRYRAEKRFKFYGLTSVILAILFVLFLVNVIFSKGKGAFSRTTISVEVDFNTEKLELKNNPTNEEIQDTDFYDLSIESLLNVYKTKGLKEEKDLIRIFSPDYEIEIKNFIIENKGFLNKTAIIELTASDDIDQLNKGNYPRHLPEERRRISDFQLLIYDKLVEDNKIQKTFNTFLFTNGDSRDPELAGVGGSLLGSFFTIIVTLLLSFPIAILASIYLEEFAPKNRITDFIEININNLAAVPSIVFGLLGLGILLGTFDFPRSTPLVAGITLALMTLPRIIIPCRASLKAVPPSIREGALAVGASKVQSVTHHVVPLAIPGTLSVNTTTIPSINPSVSLYLGIISAISLLYLIVVPSDAVTKRTTYPPS